MVQNASYVADADVFPSKFVKLVTAKDYRIVQCGAGDLADAGITHEGTQDAALPGLNANQLPAAKANTHCQVYGLGEVCEILAPSGANAGDRLKPDANADAIPVVGNEAYSAIAINSVAAGERVHCRIEREAGAGTT